MVGGKLQEGKEGLRPGGPQIPPGLGSLDSVGGGGGGRGLSGQRQGRWGGRLGREAWPLAAGPAGPPQGRGRTGSGASSWAGAGGAKGASPSGGWAWASSLLFFPQSPDLILLCLRCSHPTQQIARAGFRIQASSISCGLTRVSIHSSSQPWGFDGGGGWAENLTPLCRPPSPIHQRRGARELRREGGWERGGRSPAPVAG